MRWVKQIKSPPLKNRERGMVTAGLRVTSSRWGRVAAEVTVGCWACAPRGVPGCFRHLIWSGKLNQSLKEKEENKGGGKWSSSRHTAGSRQWMVIPHCEPAACSGWV